MRCLNIRMRKKGHNPMTMFGKKVWDPPPPKKKRKKVLVTGHDLNDRIREIGSKRVIKNAVLRHRMNPLFVEQVEVYFRRCRLEHLGFWALFFSRVGDEIPVTYVVHNCLMDLAREIKWVGRTYDTSIELFEE